LRKSSHSSSGTNGGILGKFLKLGKSKSDAHQSSNYIKRRPGTGTTSGGDELEDDFVLAPVQLRGVEKMVHRANTTKKDNVSRSHSWIYGSVKLPADLPFGYGGGGGGYESHPAPTTNGSSPSSNGTHHPHSQHPAGEKASGTPHVQIPRCQTGDFYSCSCDDEYCKFLSGSSAPPSSTKQPPTCQACHSQLVLPGGSSSNRKQPNSQLQSLLQLDSAQGKKFASSVRKLTWKSLKQAVKKRPSLDSIITKRQPEGGGGSSEYANYCSQDDFFNSSTTNYFFPEKKSSNYYASCTDLFGTGPPENPYVTASVRVRPKRSRPTWNFPNEFGPVPNYQEEAEVEGGIYHSEWDLRQCMPYEQWLTSSTGARLTGQPFLDDIFSNPVVSSIKITNNNNNNNAHNKRVNKPSNNEGGKTNNVNHLHNGPGHNSSSKAGQAQQKTPNPSDLYTNGGVKRFSILHHEASAYQLNKAERDGDDGEGESDAESQDGSHVLLAEADPVRIAGQGIFMLTAGTSNGHHGGLKVTRSNSTSSAKYKNNSSFGTNKGNHPHHLLLSSARSEADGVWSDTQAVEEPPPPAAVAHKESPYSARDRSQLTQLGHHDKSERDGVMDQKVQLLKTFKHSPPPQQAKNGVDLVRLNGNGNVAPDEDRNGTCSVTTIKTGEVVGNHKRNGVSEKESLYAKNVSLASSKGIIKGSGKRGTSSGGGGAESENKYGALRRRRGGRVSTGGKNNLLRETIYEEESESLEHPDGETHAVKILVSQTGSPADYVKPILKTRIATGTDEMSTSELIYDDTSTSVPTNRSSKKVQFNSTEEIVLCRSGAESSESYSEEEEEEGGGSEEDLKSIDRRTQDTNTWAPSNQEDSDHDNEPINPVDEQQSGAGGKSGWDNQGIDKEPPSPVRKEQISIKRTLEPQDPQEHGLPIPASQSSPIIKTKEEVPHLCRVKVGKEKSETTTNEVNNLPAIPRSLNHQDQAEQESFQNELRQNQRIVNSPNPIKMSAGPHPPPFVSKQKSSESSTGMMGMSSSREKSGGMRMTEDEKMILSKLKRIHNSKAGGAAMSKGERIRLTTPINGDQQSQQISTGNDKGNLKSFQPLLESNFFLLSLKYFLRSSLKIESPSCMRQTALTQLKCVVSPLNIFRLPCLSSSNWLRRCAKV